MEQQDSKNPPASVIKRPGSAARRVVTSNVSNPSVQARNPTQQPPTVKQSVVTIWDFIKENQKKTNGTLSVAPKEPSETNVLVIGPEASGKTSLIYRIIQKDFRKEEPEPTVGLEYRFRKKEDNFRSFVANFWELAGGRTLTNLLDDLITPDNVHSFVVVVVVDLSNPQQCFSDALFYINKINSLTNSCCKVLKQRGSDFPDKMMSRQQKRIGEKHPDLKQIELSGIQMVIVATHYDMFKMKTPPQLAVMNQWLRYIAHKTASSLIYMGNISNDASSDTIESFKTNDTFDRSFRSLMNAYIFGSSEKQMKCIEKLKPIRVLAGKDNFPEIGKPTVSSKSMDNNLKENYKKLIEPNLTAFNEAAMIESWYSLFVEQFGYEGSTEKEYNLLDLISAEYKEPGIDSIRTQKDEELANYRRMMEQERQRKLAAAAEQKQRSQTQIPKRPTQFSTQ